MTNDMRGDFVYCEEQCRPIDLTHSLEAICTQWQNEVKSPGY